MSDLIERYGYERAVRELKAMDDRAIWMISSCLKYREEVRKECLEYRRANNIFEVGDFIVLLHTNYRSDVFALTKSFKEIYDEKGIVYRHATDAEIQAGRRL